MDVSDVSEGDMITSPRGQGRVIKRMGARVRVDGVVREPRVDAGRPRELAACQENGCGSSHCA